MTGSIDARVEKSRNALIQVGLELLLQKPDASLSEIAEQAGVGRTTLYRQFNSRDELIQAIALRCLQELDEATAGIAARSKSYTQVIELLFVDAMTLPDRLRFLTTFWAAAERDPAIRQHEKQKIREMSEVIEHAKKEGSIDPEMPTDWIADLIDGLLQVSWKLVEDSGYSPEQAAKLMTKTLFDGIRPRP